MKINTIITLAILTIIFVSCDSELEIPQNNNITSENLYNTEYGAMAGLAGAYSSIISVYKSARINAVYPTNFTDEGHFNRIGTHSFLKNNFTATDIYLRSIWTNCYGAVSAINTLIEGLNNSILEEKKKTEFLGDAYFLRALIYFDLQKAFGGLEGLPMPLDTSKKLLPRTAGIDVYMQIVKDLEFAEQNLPVVVSSVSERANKSSARGLLARAYLYMASKPFNKPGAYEKARTWSKKVIDDSYHRLNPSYKDIFNKLAKGEYEKREILFQIGFFSEKIDFSRSSALGAFFGMKMDDEKCGGKGYAFVYATISLILKYRSDPSDERGLWNTYPYFGRRKNNCELNAITSQFMIPPSKYRRFLEKNNTNINSGTHHWPVLRFSDILLIYAEAENKLNQGSELALHAVNRVRNRAKATPLSTITDELIQDERLLELCFEGHRKYDLVRWGILEDKINETKKIMTELSNDSNFINEDWTSYGEPNLGPDRKPESGDEPLVRKIKKNIMPLSFSYFDGYENFNPSKHYILPIPEQELGVNTNLKQTYGW